MLQDAEHGEVQQLLGVYALDSVDAAEAAFVAAHLGECSECREELRRHLEVVAMLSAAHDHAPGDVWDGIARSMTDSRRALAGRPLDLANPDHSQPETSTILPMGSEVLSELRAVVLGRASIVDGIVPPLVFGIGNALVSTKVAAVLAVGSALMIIAVRLQKGRSLKFALAGLFGVIAAAVSAIWLGPEGFFIPSIISGAGTTLLILISLIVNRPFVAFTSWLARDWPLDWYWHPQVRPAYTRISWIWLVFFATRTVGQWLTLEDAGWATAYRLAAGWPALLVLLIVTYTLGRRFLLVLAGPSVAEFVDDQPPPWRGQATGF
jgi:hypothetical protein